MASFTSRLAGWAAGRLKGEKARKKTMEFVDKTGVGQALGFLGDAALLGGAGKLAKAGATAVGAKLGFGGVGVGSVPSGASPTQRVFDPTRGGYVDVGGTSSPVSMADRLAAGAGRIGEMARGAGSYIAKKPEVAGMALKEFNTSRQATANRALEREGMAQAQRQFDETLGLRKRDEEREVERQRRIAQMLAPLFQRIAGGQR